MHLFGRKEKGEAEMAILKSSSVLSFLVKQEQRNEEYSDT
jgi:hypothetical protein